MNIERSQRVSTVLEQHMDYDIRVEVLQDLITGSRTVLHIYAVDTNTDTYYDGDKWRQGFNSYANMIHDWNLENEPIGHRRIVA